MSKTGASLVFIIMISSLCLHSTVKAQDPLDLDAIYPSLPNLATQEMEVQWHGKDRNPFWGKYAPDSLDMAPAQVPGKRSFLLGSLTDGILDGMRNKELHISDEKKDALLMGEPQDTSCMMGLRYSFSEFDFGHFYKSLSTLFSNKHSRATQEDQGFTFYLE